jgi:predicted P-loop ATPase
MSAREEWDRIRPPRASWRDRLIKTRQGRPRPILANAIVAFSEAPEWCGALSYDLFHLRTLVTGELLWPELGKVWTDVHDIRAAEWLQHEGIFVGRDIAGQAIEAVAHTHAFHPVIDYLWRCKWDKTPRLDLWSVTYLGAPDNDYVRAVSAKWMISAVARIFQPGCKADCALVLEGRQSLLKSTALKTIGAPWFADELAEFGSKDAALQLAGKWIIELAELDNVTRGEVSRIKAFMSRAVDWYRPPYAKHPIEQPRQCVFAGTVNPQEYLRDETGNRRFWPLECTQIDIPGLAAARDQLWAEARKRYQAGESWWLDNRELIEDAEEEQDARYQHDAWEKLICDYVGAKDWVTVGEILENVLHIEAGKWTQVDQNRVARCLRHMKWQRKRVRIAGTDKREWRYFAP